MKRAKGCFRGLCVFVGDTQVDSLIENIIARAHLFAVGAQGFLREGGPGNTQKRVSVTNPQLTSALCHQSHRRDPELGFISPCRAQFFKTQLF